LRKAGVGLAVAAALLLAHELPASAAIEATLSSSEGRPGELIVLTTENHGIANLYESLASAGPHLIYLASKANFDREVARGIMPCGAPDRRSLGKLSWNSGTGSLSFRVPNVPNGDYYFIMTQAESSRSCWRIGAPAAPFGPVVFTVKGSAAVVSPVPAGSSVRDAAARGSRWALIVIVVGAVVLGAAAVLVTVGLRRRHDSG